MTFAEIIAGATGEAVLAHPMSPALAAMDQSLRDLIGKLDEVFVEVTPEQADTITGIAVIALKMAKSLQAFEWMAAQMRKLAETGETGETK